MGRKHPLKDRRAHPQHCRASRQRPFVKCQYDVVNILGANGIQRGPTVLVPITTSTGWKTKLALPTRHGGSCDTFDDASADALNHAKTGMDINAEQLAHVDWRWQGGFRVSRISTGCTARHRELRMELKPKHPTLGLAWGLWGLVQDCGPCGLKP